MTAFLCATGEVDFDTLARRADADPAWLMQEVFRFCDVRFYRPYDQMLDLSRGQPWARWCVGGTTNIVLNCIVPQAESDRTIRRKRRLSLLEMGCQSFPGLGAGKAQDFQRRRGIK